MDIAALSMGMSQSKVQQDASTLVMKIALGNVREQGNMVNELLSSSTKSNEQSAQPHIGGNIDLRV